MDGTKRLFVLFHKFKNPQKLQQIDQKPNMNLLVSLWIQYKQTTNVMNRWCDFISCPPIVISYLVSTLIQNTVKTTVKSLPLWSETCSTWHYLTIFKHAVIGIAHVRTPPPKKNLLIQCCCESQDHPTLLGVGKPNSAWILKRLFSMQGFAERFIALWEIAFVLLVDPLTWEYAPAKLPKLQNL